MHYYLSFQLLIIIIIINLNLFYYYHYYFQIITHYYLFCNLALNLNNNKKIIRVSRVRVFVQ